jgi:hypothetical protein
MNKIIIIIFGILMWTAGFSQFKADSVSKKNFICLSLSQFFSNTFQPGYERQVSSKIGISLNCGYTNKGNNDDGKRGFNGELQGRYTLLNRKFSTVKEEFYVGPYTRFQYMESRLGYYNWNSSKKKYDFIDQREIYVKSGTLGIMAGMKWIFFSGFTIETILGGGIQISELNGKKASEYMDLGYYGYHNGVISRLSIQVGYNF